MEKQTVFRKVSVKDRLPLIDNDYFTNVGKVHFRGRFYYWVEWWLEEIELPSEDELNKFKPIKLTEEILLKLGFIRGSVTMYFLPIPNLKCEIHATWFHNQYVIELHNDRIPIVTEVKYLHQLQNLFYALTGEELEIKF